MPREYENCNAICPFFLTGGKLHINGIKTRDYIKCEGVNNDCTIDLVFVSEKKKNAHRCAYCDSYNYKKCQIYKAVIKKYEE